jgi:hypothetical protein
MPSKNEPKNHHFIPRFYLEKFTSKDADQVVWTYDTKGNRAWARSPDNTAIEKHLYSVTMADGCHNTSIEEHFSKIESKATPILDKLIECEKLSDLERVNFAIFLAIMYVRTDAFRQNYAELEASFLSLKNHRIASSKRLFEAHMRKYQEAVGALSEDEINDLKDGMLNPQKFSITLSKKLTLKALGAYESLSPFFYEMNWTVLTTSSPRYFITSDNPVALLIPPKKINPFYHGGLSDSNIELTFPLSSQTCLLATWDNDLPPNIEVGREYVKQINRIRADYAMRFLYCNKRDSGVQRLGEKYAGPPPTIKISGSKGRFFSSVGMHR